MQPPTWKEVGIPDIMVRTIQDMQPTYAMDCLVNQMVFHNAKRLILTYVCDHCGHTHNPNRTNEEIGVCPQCQQKRVRCIQSVKFGAEKKTPYYTRTGTFLASIIEQMKMNFFTYFQSVPQRDIDWEWHDNAYHVAFAGGETGIGQIPRLAIARAALLTPYLWDSMQDWKNQCRRDIIDQRLITQYLNHFALPKRNQ